MPRGRYGHAEWKIGSEGHTPSSGLRAQLRSVGALVFRVNGDDRNRVHFVTSRHRPGDDGLWGVYVTTAYDSNRQWFIPYLSLMSISKLLARIGWHLGVSTNNQVVIAPDEALTNLTELRSKSAARRTLFAARQQVERAATTLTALKNIRPQYLRESLIDAIIDDINTWPDVIVASRTPPPFLPGLVQSSVARDFKLHDHACVYVQYWPVQFAENDRTTGLTTPITFVVPLQAESAYGYVVVADAGIHPHLYSDGHPCVGSAHFGNPIQTLAEIRRWVTGTDGGPANRLWQEQTRSWWKNHGLAWLAQQENPKRIVAPRQSEGPTAVAQVTELTPELVAKSSERTAICGMCSEPILWPERRYIRGVSIVCAICYRRHYPAEPLNFYNKAQYVPIVPQSETLRCTWPEQRGDTLWCRELASWHVDPALATSAAPQSLCQQHYDWAGDASVERPPSLSGAGYKEDYKKLPAGAMGYACRVMVSSGVWVANVGLQRSCGQPAAYRRAALTIAGSSYVCQAHYDGFENRPTPTVAEVARAGEWSPISVNSGLRCEYPNHADSNAWCRQSATWAARRPYNETINNRSTAPLYVCDAHHEMLARVERNRLELEQQAQGIAATVATTGGSIA